jgi:hypothetical protein
MFGFQYILEEELYKTVEIYLRFSMDNVLVTDSLSNNVFDIQKGFVNNYIISIINIRDIRLSQIEYIYNRMTNKVI